MNKRNSVIYGIHGNNLNTLRVYTHTNTCLDKKLAAVRFNIRVYKYTVYTVILDMVNKYNKVKVVLLYTTSSTLVRI